MEVIVMVKCAEPNVLTKGSSPLKEVAVRKKPTREVTAIDFMVSHTKLNQLYT